MFWPIGWWEPRRPVIAEAPFWNGPQLAGNWDVIWYYTLQHIRYTVIAVALGTIVSFPIAYLSVRRPTTYPVILSVTNAIYAIPSIALFVLLGAGARHHQRQADHRRHGAVHARDPRAQHRRGDPRRAADRGCRGRRHGLPTARPLRCRRAAPRPARHRRRAAAGDGEHRVADQRRRAHRPRRARPAVRRRPRPRGSPTSCGRDSSPSSCSPSCSTRSLVLVGRWATPWTRDRRPAEPVVPLVPADTVGKLA